MTREVAKELADDLVTKWSDRTPMSDRITKDERADLVNGIAVLLRANVKAAVEDAARKAIGAGLIIARERLPGSDTYAAIEAAIAEAVR